jgi:ferritin
VGETFEAALTHEREVTRRIEALADLAAELRDHASANLLQWFVNEQVEEEATLRDLIARIGLLGGSGPGLFMLDRELAARPAPIPPPGLAGATA